jgi:xanthosine utilization system XapX-like protein
MDKLTALVAFAALAAFLGILAFEVPSPDLIAVILLTGALVAYDFVSSSGNRKR